MFSNGYASEILPVFRLSFEMSASVGGKSCRRRRMVGCSCARRPTWGGWIAQRVSILRRFGVPAL